MMYARYVGVPPGTSTITLGQESAEIPTLTTEQFYARDIALREKETKWRMVGAFASATLSGIAILAAIGAYMRTGRLQPPK